MPKQSNEMNSMNVGGQNSGPDKEVQAKAYDQNAAADRMTKLREKVRLQKDAEKTRESELMKVTVAESDVAFVADALNCANTIAARRLRERNGDVNAVLRDAVNGKHWKA